MRLRSFRQRRAQSIVETVVGLLFLVPVVLFLLDVSVVVMANISNRNLAKSCCRAAASAVDSTQTPPVGNASAANLAAYNVAKQFASSALISPSGSSFLTGFGYCAPSSPAVVTGSQTALYPGKLPNGASAPAALQVVTDPTSGIQTGQVGCVTTVVVTLPVPFPLVPSSFTLANVDVEPIVSPQKGM